MKVALVYDRVNKWGGAERVLLALHEMFPDAPLFTSVYDPETAPWADVFPIIITSFLQKIPGARTRHELFALLMPIAFESFDFSEYDIVISVTSEAAKGIITRPETKHICYCLTPTRYLWSGYEEYFKDAVFKRLGRPFVGYLRKWDKVAAQRPDVMIAISTEVQKRIKKYYNRKSIIVYPPVDVNNFQFLNNNLQSNSSSQFPNEYYLIVSRLVPYKRIDLAIKVFNQLKYSLIIVGKGNEGKKLKEMAGSTITFQKDLTDAELVHYYRNAKALVFPQSEDFGLVAVESQSVGTPVIAYKSGGVLDTVVDSETGILFDDQSEKSLLQAIKRFEETKFDRRRIMKVSEQFSTKKFRNELLKITQNDKEHL